MSFAKTLRESVERVNGAISAMIIGIDGMPVESHTTEKMVNLEDLSAESSQLLRGIGQAAETLRIGDAKELAIVSDNCTIIFRKITHEYFYVLIIKPGGNIGKGRFILRSLIPQIEKDF